MIRLLLHGYKPVELVRLHNVLEVARGMVSDTDSAKLTTDLDNAIAFLNGYMDAKGE